MSIPPEFLFTPEVPSGPPPPPPPRRIPHIGHTVLFFTVAIIVLLLASVSVFALAMGFHLLGNETPEQLLREPRLLIPSMAAAYLIAGAIVWAIFTYLWQKTFLDGLHWNFTAVRRRWMPLLGGGIALSLVVQFLSNYLPVPKTLPIDDFFRNSADVWMVALFGTFVAPIFEELAFRGFLLPSLASAWDWLQGRRENADLDQDPHWSVAALVVSCTITSIAFALVHADQLAHAWAPLAVLFAVSLVLCGVRLWTQSLAASTFIHATYNGTIFTILFFVTGGFRHLDKIK
ncbi:MAG TPA: type II CAAX endopeptidase family protein [Acidobacteriaceae bacterium]|nr:type II CAAX endopeptidase family protein [Acidobacteriaceae bacterium]